MKKYKLTNETKSFGDKTLYRIKCLVDHAGNGKGSLGGWVSGEHNLSHEGGCWIDEEAIVMDDAHVSGEAMVRDNAIISGSAKIYDLASVSHTAQVGDHAQIYGKATVADDSRVFGKSKVFENAYIGDNAMVNGSPIIHGDTRIYADAIVFVENKSLHCLVIADDSYCLGDPDEFENVDEVKEDSEKEYKIIDGIKFRKKIIWEQV